MFNLSEMAMGMSLSNIRRSIYNVYDEVYISISYQMTIIHLLKSLFQSISSTNHFV